MCLHFYSYVFGVDIEKPRPLQGAAHVIYLFAVASMTKARTRIRIIFQIGFAMLRLPAFQSD
jgi:hypothetical protein